MTNRQRRLILASMIGLLFLVSASAVLVFSKYVAHAEAIGFKNNKMDAPWNIPLKVSVFDIDEKLLDSFYLFATDNYSNTGSEGFVLETNVTIQVRNSMTNLGDPTIIGDANVVVDLFSTSIELKSSGVVVGYLVLTWVLER